MGVALVHKKKESALMHDSLFRAENEARTRDPNLGKVVLYQLSYFRKFVTSISKKNGIVPFCGCKGTAFC